MTGELRERRGEQEDREDREMWWGWERLTGEEDGFVAGCGNY